MKLFGCALSMILVGSLAACGSDATEPTHTGDELVGGTPDLRWPAAGYLVHAPSLEAAGQASVACGATLVAPNVIVTAAHCVLAAPNDVWAFGTGNVGSTLTPVLGQRIHPDFHAEPESHFDTRYYLHDFDLATLVLAAPLDVAPARLPAVKTAVGCSYSAIGYHTDTSAPATRVSTSACVEFRVELGGDPIFEVHPTGGSGLCHGDGDEGSPLFSAGDEPILQGIYVGSVTQGFTDCHGGAQFLDGYEAMFGFADFVQQSIDAAQDPQ